MRTHFYDVKRIKEVGAHFSFMKLTDEIFYHCFSHKLIVQTECLLNRQELQRLFTRKTLEYYIKLCYKVLVYIIVIVFVRFKDCYLK